MFWDVRKGLIPIVGGGRETGTSMLIEDVAVEVDKLGALTMDLIEMFQRHGYKDASCFGHALEGNLHLVFSQVRRDDATHVSLLMDLRTTSEPRRRGGLVGGVLTCCACYPLRRASARRTRWSATTR